MKKLLSLLMSMVLFITIIGAVPVVSAKEIQYEPVSEEFIKKYWKYREVDEVVKADGWYYNFTENYLGERYISGVCGYDGIETEITIPTEFDGKKVDKIEHFYLISDTVKTINIPRGVNFENHLFFDEYIKFNPTSNLEAIVVEKGHRNYWSEDGILYDGLKLSLYPPEKKDEEYVIPDYITEIGTGAISQQKYLKSLTITEDVSLINEYSITPTLENLYFHTENDLFTNLCNLYWSHEGPASFVEMPQVPNGTIHCIEGTELHSFYSKRQDSEKYFKNLDVLKDQLIKKEDGKWYHYRGGVIRVNNSYSYIIPDLVKYKGKWFYTERGVWRKSDLLFEKNGTWFYIDNGKWEKTTNDLKKYKDKWFYIEKGKWNSATKTLFKKNGKWFAIKSGKWYKGKDIISFKGKKFYVNKGFVQFKYSGKVKIDGKTYKIKNGKVA